MPIEALDPLGDARAVLGRLRTTAGGPASREILQCLGEALDNPAVFLPRLPESAIQATQVVDSPRCDVLDLADTLNADPTLALRVVDIANQSFFAGAEPVHTARDAIVRMGIRETRNVVLGVAVRTLVCDGPGYPEQRKWLWQHSLATAACAQGIMCELTFADCMGFIAGLAHELGRSALLSWMAERGRLDIGEGVLRPISDAIHPSLGAALLMHWRMRYELIEAVRWHHDSASRVQTSPVSAALAAADQMAHSMVGDRATSPSDPKLLRMLDALGISAERALQLQIENRARFDELLKIL